MVAKLWVISAPGGVSLDPESTLKHIHTQHNSTGSQVLTLVPFILRSYGTYNNRTQDRVNL